MGNTPGVCVNDHWEDHAACGKSSTCQNDDCVVCQNNTANCDEDPQNGCEADLTTVLYTGTSCASCPAGYANCNLDSNDGCEIDLSSSLDHCGSCGKKASKACYRDGDGDGFGNPKDTVTVCSACSSGWIEDNTDCDDLNPEAHPWQTHHMMTIPDGTTNWDLDCDGEVSCEACDNHGSCQDIPKNLVYCGDYSLCNQTLEIRWLGPDGQATGQATVYHCGWYYDRDGFGWCKKLNYPYEEYSKEMWDVSCL